MKFLMSEKLGPHRYIDNSGYLICTDAILSRTGLQDYIKSEIFPDSKDTKTVIHVDRPYNEVFSDAAMASFENKPIVVEHPDEDVNPENCRDYSVGFVRDIHPGKDNGVDVMMSTVVITDQDAIEQVQNGDYQYLSCGYDCDFVGDDNGMKQTNIRGNHVALCKTPRAGITRIQDSLDSPVSLCTLTASFKLRKDYEEAKKYAIMYDIKFEEASNALTFSGQEKFLDNVKSVLESDYNATCTMHCPGKSADSQYGEAIERNTVTIRRGYHNLSIAADNFKDVYKLAMKETSAINIRLVINTLETMYIDAYNDSRQAYQSDIANVAIEHYKAALQYAVDFKIKKHELLSDSQIQSIEKYVSAITDLLKQIKGNAVESTFKQDILETLDRYDENNPIKKEDENSIQFGAKPEATEAEKPVEAAEKPVEKPAAKDSTDPEYVVIANSPEEAVAMVKYVKEH